jgi:hypothetical protein
MTRDEALKIVEAYVRSSDGSNSMAHRQQQLLHLEKQKLGASAREYGDWFDAIAFLEGYEQGERSGYERGRVRESAAMAKGEFESGSPTTGRLGRGVAERIHDAIIALLDVKEKKG